MPDIDLLGPAASGAARTVSSTDPTITSTIAFPDSADSWFKDCVANVAGTGTTFEAEFINRLLQQQRRLIRNTGVPLSNADDDMLGQAVQSGALNWAGTFGGTANALTATLTPAPPILSAGLRIAGIVGSSPNTGAATLNLNALGAVAVLRFSGVALTGGELRAGAVVELEYDGTAWRIVSAFAQPGPTRLLYISSTQTITVGAGETRCRVRGWGAGGGGGGTSGSGSGGSGGGGAGFCDALITGLTAGQTILAIIGAGGAGGTTAPTNGSAGGTTSFGSFITWNGGGGGSDASGALQTTTAGAGGTVTVSGVAAAATLNGIQGGLAWGTWQTTFFAPSGGAGGTSPFSGAGFVGNVNSAGSPGFSPGVGGNGSSGGAGVAGAGANAFIIVEMLP